RHRRRRVSGERRAVPRQPRDRRNPRFHPGRSLDSGLSSAPAHYHARHPAPARPVRHGPVRHGPVRHGRVRHGPVGRPRSRARRAAERLMPGHKASEDARRRQIVRAAYEIASRSGLAGLTVRRVATRAGLSTGLVIFHFTTKERLVVALLDYVLENTTVLHVTSAIAAIPSPLDRLLALLT